MVQQVLRITQDTVFKLRTEQSSQLAPQEMFEVKAGQTYNIQSYAYANATGDFNGHIKFALENQSIRGLNTWFVYDRHAQVEFDGRVVYPIEDHATFPVLYITQNTVVKRRPIQSAALPPEEKADLPRGKRLVLHSYAYADNQGDFSSHIKFALCYERDYIRELSTWFVYDQHAYVEYDGEVVYPPEDPNTFLLRITQNTVFKRRPLSSSQLAANEVYAIPKDTTLKLQSYAFADATGRFNGHIKFALKYDKDYVQDLSTWFVYEGHARVEQNGKVVYPAPTPVPVPTPTPTPTPAPAPAPRPIYNGIPLRLPGNTGVFYTDQPIIPGGSFTWGEATKNGSRIPASAAIVDNIVALARQLQKAREQVGRPFRVNSWYRPPAINAAVGGVSNSQHLYGKAVDLEVVGYSGRRLANAVMLWWPGGVGIYPHMPNLLHLDIGPRRVWGF